MKNSGDLELRNLHCIYSFAQDKQLFTECLKSIHLNDLSGEQISAMFKLKKGFTDVERFFYYPEHLSSFNKLIPALKKLSPEQISMITDIMTIVEDYKNLDKVSLVNKSKIYNFIKSIPQDIRAELKENGLSLDTLEQKLKVLAKTKGFDVRVDMASQAKFVRTIMGNNNAMAKKVLESEELSSFLTKNVSKGLPLKYSRFNFSKELNDLLSKLSESEKAKVLEQMNITLNQQSFDGFINPRKIELESFSPATQKTVSEIKELAEKFVYGNEIVCDNPEIKSVLDDLVKGFPEFISIVGKQDGAHQNALDIHTLQVLTNAVKSDNYKALSDADKTILKLAILLHDAGKMEGIDDAGAHCASSAILISSALDKFNLNFEMKERIVNLVRYHHFSSEDSKSFSDHFRTKEDGILANILGSADVSARFGHNDIIKEGAFTSYSWPMGPAPVHMNYQVNKKYPKYTRVINGKEYTIPYLNGNKLSPDTDMSLYGYPKGTKFKDIVVQQHSVTSIENAKTVLANYEDPNMDMTVSLAMTKLMTPSNNYGHIGLITRVSKMNRGGGNYFGNAHTGKGARGLNHFVASYKNSYLDNNFITAQDIPDALERNALNNYFSKITNVAGITEQKIGDRLYTKEELMQLYKTVTDRMGGNEQLALNPMPVQMILRQYIESPDEIPDEYIVLCSDYNIGLFSFGEKE
jgi:hypothetical protein